MFLRSISKFIAVALVMPMVLANVGCSGSEETPIRGPKGNGKTERPVQPQELEIKAWEKTFAEADSMFDQVWAKIHERKEIENISSPFSIVQEAIKDTLMRQERDEKIDCVQHQNGTEFLEFTGAAQTRIVRKVICVNRAPVNREIVRLQMKGQLSSRWQFATHEMEEVLGQVFVRRATRPKFITCDANVANDGIIEMLDCKGAGRDYLESRSEYVIFDLYQYRRKGAQRVLAIDARVVNVSTNKETKKKFELKIKGDATLEITLPQSDEPDVQEAPRLVPEESKTQPAAQPQVDENGVPVATPNANVQAVPVKKDGADNNQPSDKAKLAAKLTPEQLAEEQEMDNVIEKHCSEQELAFIKKQVHSKAEIADSCVAGEIIRQEVTVDQLPSTR